ncbi:hypothetical protein Dimus_011228 [Dionaea muscipula]
MKTKIPKFLLCLHRVPHLHLGEVAAAEPRGSRQFGLDGERRRARRAATRSSRAEQVSPALSVSFLPTNPTVHNSRSGERQAEGGGSHLGDRWAGQRRRHPGQRRRQSSGGKLRSPSVPAKSDKSESGDTLSSDEVWLRLGVCRHCPCLRLPPLLVAVSDMTRWSTVDSLLVSSATPGGSLWWNDDFVCLWWIGL